jgi:tetratricopeptide (TPR) repeat protein
VCSSDLKVIEPLAKSENEQWLWRRLASLESKGKGIEQATQRISSALKKDPSSTEWRDLKAMVDLRAGRYDEAIKTLEALQRDKSEGVDVRNNLIWARLMAGKLDEQTERETIRLTNERSSEATLHTAAMVLLERGRVLEAANFGERRQLGLGDELDEPQWLFRGRLLNLLGFPELGREALNKVKEDPELVDLAGRFRRAMK